VSAIKAPCVGSIDIIVSPCDIGVGELKNGMTGVVLIAGSMEPRRRTAEESRADHLH
jgi:hypothetical protein